MNLRNIQQWQSKFREGRTNIQNNERKGQPSTVLDKTMRCVHTLLKEDHYHYYWRVKRDGSTFFTQSW